MGVCQGTSFGVTCRDTVRAFVRGVEGEPVFVVYLLLFICCCRYHTSKAKLRLKVHNSWVVGCFCFLCLFVR